MDSKNKQIQSHPIQDNQSLSPIVPSGGWGVWIHILDMFPSTHGKPMGKKQPQIMISVYIFTKAPYNTPHTSVPFKCSSFLRWGISHINPEGGPASAGLFPLNCNEKFRKVGGDRAWYLWAEPSLAAWERKSKSLGFFPSFCSSWADSITSSYGYWFLGVGAFYFTVSLSG